MSDYRETFTIASGHEINGLSRTAYEVADNYQFVLHLYNTDKPFKATYENWDELVNDLLDELATEHDLIINYPDWSNGHVTGFLRVFRCPAEEPCF